MIYRGSYTDPKLKVVMDGYKWIDGKVKITRLRHPSQK